MTLIFLNWTNDPQIQRGTRPHSNQDIKLVPEHMSYTLIEYPKEHKQEERTYPLYFFWGERIRLFEKRTTCYLLNTDHDSCNDLHVVYDNNCDDNQIKTSSMTTTLLTAQRLILPNPKQSTHLFNHCKSNTKRKNLPPLFFWGQLAKCMMLSILEDKWQAHYLTARLYLFKKLIVLSTIRKFPSIKERLTSSSFDPDI